MTDFTMRFGLLTALGAALLIPITYLVGYWIGTQVGRALVEALPV